MALIAAIAATCSGQVFAETQEQKAANARMNTILQSACQNNLNESGVAMNAEECKKFADLATEAQKAVGTKIAGSLSNQSEDECKAKYDKIYADILKAVGNKPEVAAKYGILDAKAGCKKSNSR